ncbi:MAG: S8 family serine peptidase [Candidatus Omnitrophota bacterium]
MKSSPVLLAQKAMSGGYLMKTAEFKAKQASARAYAAVLRAEQDAVEQEILKAAPSAKIHRRFTNLLNAMTVEAGPEEQTQWASLPGVAYIAPVCTVKPMLTKSVTLVHLPEAWELLGGGEKAGEGVYIAIIDTGVDVTHPAFDDEGFVMPDGFPKGNASFTNNKIIAAHVFPPNGRNKGDTTLFDREGHGTDVSSIAAANFNVDSPLGPLSGGAPKAYLGNYKVFTLSSGADSDQIVAAVEQAVEDGADVINLSLGSDVFGDPQHDPQILSLRNAVDLGAVVVVAGGNSGKDYTIGNPAQAEEAITVGAVTNRHAPSASTDDFEASFYLGLSVIVEGETVLSDAQAIFGGGGSSFTAPYIGTFPIKDLDLMDGGSYGGSGDGLFCADVSLPAPLNAWLLVQRGDCLFADKVKRAQAAGANGVIFMDNKDAAGDQPGVEGSSLPSMMISKSAGKTIKDALKDGLDVKIDIHSLKLNSSSSTPSHMASYSSEGPTAEYLLKPDLSAVGHSLFGATQNDDTTQSTFAASGFYWYAGTSMASPQVAGIAALIRQEHPDWPPAWIKSVLVTNANRSIYKASPSNSLAAIVECGGGLADANAASEADTVVVPSILSLGKYMLYSKETAAKPFTIVNVSDRECEYALTRDSSENTIQTVLSEDRFTIAPGGKKEIRVSFIIPSSLASGDHESNLLLKNETTGKTYPIPFWVRTEPVNQPSGNILLVDDDEGESYQTFYQEALTTAGYSYSTWDVKTIGEYPTLNYLSAFRTVVWFLSTSSLNSYDQSTDAGYEKYVTAYNSRHLFESAMMLYLTGGGTLFLTGQDFLDDKEEAAFPQEILGVEMADHDHGANTIQGFPENTIFSEIGNINLSYPGNFENFPDLIAPIASRGIATSAFYANGNKNNVVGVTIETSGYRAIFLAFPLELSTSTSEAATIIQKGLQWLEEAESASPRLTRITPDTIDLSQNSGPVPIAIEGDGFFFANGYRAYLDFATIDRLQRVDSHSLSGEAPAGLQPGVYTLKVQTGDGRRLQLENALTVVANNAISDWSLF